MTTSKRKPTVETRKRMSESWDYNKHFTEKTRRRMSESQKLRCQNPEERERKSIVATRLWQDSKYREKMVRAMRNAAQDPKRRERISQTSKERWQDNEYRNRMAKAQKRRYQNPEERRKIGVASKRCWQNPSYKKKMSEIFRQCARDPERKRELSMISKKRWQNPEFRKKMNYAHRIQNITKNSQVRPTKAEQRLIDIIQAHDLPYKYVGDYKFWIENINPDFVECNGKKVALEVFSSYYHNPLENIGLEYHRTYRGRIETLKKYGWKCIIFWDYEVDDEKLVLERLGVK